MAGQRRSKQGGASTPAPAPERARAEPAAGSEPSTAERERRFPIVGIGASAGGLEALRALVGGIEPGLGIAFVIIQHLDPTRESLTAELLGHGARVPVTEARDGMAVDPDHVYVIPPGGDLRIQGHTLRVTAPAEPRGMRAPIDHFFRSLAESEEERAIGIILSGTGRDGTQGVREIKAAGGMAMVQTPETAAHGGMPRSALGTGQVDYVLPVEGMPDALRRYVRHWYVNREPEPAPTDEGPDHVRAILGLLRARTRYDFTGYKKGTVTRRIQRRMSLSHVERTEDYVALLRDKPDELLALHRDLLIGVTNFFREPEGWAALEEHVIEPLVRAHQGGPAIRAWVPACATGEEAYSLAMLFVEHCQAAGSATEVQVFASDIDPEALAFARAGVYPETIAADVPAHRLRRFFTRDDSSYRINRQVREMVVFAEQNVIGDPPFSRLDLVSCRNLLIYLEPEVQRRVLSLFHFALLEGGYLFLGNSETITPQQKLFQPVSRPHRIFQRAKGLPGSRLEIPLRHGPRAPVVAPEAAALPGGAAHRRLAGLAQQHLLHQFVPACAIVTARGEVMFLGGPIDRFLRLPEGEPTSDVMALVRGALRHTVQAALARAQTEQQKVVVGNVQLAEDGAERQVRITVEPLREPSDLAGLLQVTFEDEPAAADQPAPQAADPAGGPATAAANGDTRDVVIRRLEEDLRNTREELQTTIEELESSNEEFKATNEEMISINEELQSTNEELETSKEELQSLNEEMQTVNHQLEFKIGELEALNNDLANLFASTDIATIFLDRQLRIRRFTPAAKRMVHVIDTDLGRPFADLARAFTDAALVDDAMQVLQRLMPIEREVDGVEGAVFLRRIMPYRTEDERIDGVVITFTDITAQKRQENELRRLNEGLTERVERRTAEVRDLIRSSPDGMLVVEADGTILEASRAEALFGYGPGELVGRNVEVLVPEHRRGQGEGDWSRALPGPRATTGARTEIVGRRRDGSELALELRASTIEVGERPVTVMAVRDLTMQEEAERIVRRLAAVVATSPAAIQIIAPDGTIQLWSPGAEALYGLCAGEAEGHVAWDVLPGETASQVRSLLEQLEQGETVVGLGATHERVDGTRIDVSITGSVIHTAAGAIDGYCVLSVDISRRRRAEQEVAEALDGERQRIGRELHDTLGQQITAIGMLISTVKGESESGRPRPATLRNLEELVGQIKTQVRLLIRGVFPVAVDSEGLQWALYELARETSELFGVTCRVESENEVELADNFTATELYWIAREAVHNAVHHGRAREVLIRLTMDGELVLAVQDNGKGIPPQLDETRTLGLRTMRHRSSIVGGRLSVARQPEGGTIVRCVVPLAGARGKGGGQAAPRR